MKKYLLILSILISSCASTSRYQASQRAKVQIPIVPPISHVDVLLTFGAVVFIVVMGANSSKKK